MELSTAFATRDLMMAINLTKKIAEFIPDRNVKDIRELIRTAFAESRKDWEEEVLGFLYGPEIAEGLRTRIRMLQITPVPPSPPASPVTVTPERPGITTNSPPTPSNTPAPAPNIMPVPATGKTLP